MAQPAEQPRAVVVTGGLTVSRLFMFIAAALFVIAAFAAGHDALGGIPAWCWGFAGFASVCLAWAL